MARHKLTESKIKTLPVGIHSDGDGLYLRVRRHSTKDAVNFTISRQWFFIYRRGAKRTELGLGGYGQGTAPVSLMVAREKADGIRTRLARGDDLDVRKTFAQVMEDVITLKAKSFRNAKHRAQWRMTLDRYAAPLHDKPIADITRDDLVATLKPIWETIPETADRTRMRIAAVIDHAKARGLYTGDNPADWRGGLKELLPIRRKLTRGHHAAVSYKLIPETMARLREGSGTSARAVEFTCLTAARTGEVRGATWEEIDFAEAIWTVPGDRMKGGREHRVPLSDRALEILQGLRQLATNELVFGGGRGGSAISATAMTKALRMASPDKTATLHGLRSTFRDWSGDCTSFSRDTIETALAHVVRDKTEAAYRRGDALEKRRALMNDWQNYCASAQ